MPAIAIVERYISNKIKKNSLTEIFKYRCDSTEEAKFLVENLRKMDRRIVDVKIEED